MKVKSIGSNKTELHLKDLILLISYETPVSLIRYSGESGLMPWQASSALKTSEFFSVTTSKHVNQWLKDNGFNPDRVPIQDQSFFDRFLEDNE